ncbi:MAG: S24 family peptidase [Oscillospiraceae bacterium]
MEIVSKLLFLKKRAGLTSKQISERSGIPIGTLNKLYSGATKNPSLQAVSQIAAVFGVPTRYFTDDSIAPDHLVASVGEDTGTFGISPREYEWLCSIRRLPEGERRTFEVLLETFRQLYPVSADTSHHINLFCYFPTSPGVHGTLAQSTNLRQITVPRSHVSAQSDFAILLSSKALEPLYSHNIILGVRRESVLSDDIGVFLLNGQGYVRIYQCAHGVRKLVTINRNINNVTVRKQDDLHCLGRVVGLLHPLHPLLECSSPCH